MTQDEEGVVITGRKDVYDITPYVDVQATMNNFSIKKGPRPYASNNDFKNALKTVLSGSVMYGDRLKAAKIIESDECTCEECQGKRHTAVHVNWECPRHKDRRKQYTQDVQKLLTKSTQEIGPHARQHLEEILKSSTFHNTGICPDHKELLAKAPDLPTPERIQEVSISHDDIITD